MYLWCLQLPVVACSIMEIAALITIAGEVFLKLRWIGWRTILRHKRTMIKVNLPSF